MIARFHRQRQTQLIPVNEQVDTIRAYGAAIAWDRLHSASSAEPPERFSARLGPDVYGHGPMWCACCVAQMLS